jgi:coenzyme F420-reducing hydrogenase alpha subunit
MSEFKKEKTPEVKAKAGDGVGVIEAPRGTLYYMMSLGKEGKINYGNLVIPTAQNQIKMEKDIRLLVPQFLKKGKERVRWEIEKLIRAYDPCTTCASHFLKIKWI